LAKLSPAVGKVREVVVGAGEAVGAGSAADTGAVENAAAARAKATRANSGRRTDVFMEEIPLKTGQGERLQRWLARTKGDIFAMANRLNHAEVGAELAGEFPR
jgi:hypothetical protein